MLTRLLMILAFIGGLYYLHWSRNRPPVVPPPPPPALQTPPQPAFADAELERIRSTANDSDPQVRWAAIQLLYKLHDPKIVPTLEYMLRYDTDPQLRQSALALIRQSAKPRALKNLMAALKDPEPAIRIAALAGLSEIGDASVAPEVSELLSDSDSRVRLQALSTLGQFQEQKRVVYQALSETLRTEYDKAVKKAQESVVPSR